MDVLPEFRLHRPTTVAEALAARGQGAEARYIAGGTDLLANVRRGLTPASALIDLSAIAELRQIERDAAGLHIGAGVTLAEIAEDAAIAADYPALSQAAASVAAPAHREAGTIGGNLCLDTRCYFYNQSDWWRQSNDFCLKYRGEICHVVPTSKRCYAAYSGDTAPALMALGAEIDVAGPDGGRRLDLADLFNDDGIDYLTLAPGELVSAIHLPPAGGRSGYEKLRIRRSIDFPLAGVAVWLEMDGDKVAALRIALTGTNARPLVVEGTDVAIGQALDDDSVAALGKLVQKQISPVHTTTTQPQYRRRAVTALSGRLLRRLAAT
jgi:4-hydroxybenzoyl-CoA reductase subunit beta|tara:strand:- start:191 stop:1162 length:972 start_codon:yes stop_codon:yes gene_type:complete